MKHLIVSILSFTVLSGFAFESEAERALFQSCTTTSLLQSNRINSGYMKDGVLHWKDEYGVGYTHHVEQFRWNKWIVVDVTITGENTDPCGGSGSCAASRIVSALG